MASGMQTFLKMANLFGPEPQQDERFGDMPSTLPTTNPMTSPLINRATSSQIPGTYEDLVEADAIADNPLAMGNEEELLAAFRQNVLNPPKREHMTYPKNTLAGLEAALKIAAEPSPLEKNRVIFDGHPYQKVGLHTDPVTGQRRTVTLAKDPSFMSQVMRAMPAAVSAAPDILNQPRMDAVADWELKNKGLKEAIGAESQLALAQQREAQAKAIPQRVEQGQQRIDISRMTAEERARVSQLNTLTDTQKIEMLQAGRISLAELQAAEAMKRLERGGEIRSGQIEQQGNIRSGQIAQQGQIRSGQIAQQGAIRSGQIEQQGGIARDLARIRGEEARTTKQTPGAAGAGGAGAGAYPTQQRVQMQANVARIANEHPEWEEFITINPEGFPDIEAPSWYGGPTLEEYNAIYNAIYGTGAAEPAAQTPAPAAKPAPKAAAPTGNKGTVRVQAPNGQTGTWDLSKGPIPPGFKKIGG